MVSGLGERGGCSWIGLPGTEDVNGREARLRGSGRLNGAGSAMGTLVGMGGRRWEEMGTSLEVSKRSSEVKESAHFRSPATAMSHPGPTTGRFACTASAYSLLTAPPRP